MWSDYAHGSSDVFPEEFDSDGGREDGNEGGREGGEQQVTVEQWFYHFSHGDSTYWLISGNVYA